MASEKLILKFEEENEEFTFENNVSVLKDRKLVSNLEKTNIKNEGSSLIIRSMNTTPIYDVIQLKINMSKTGVFLVNFSKESLDENTRENLIKEVSSLKTNITPTVETQLKKTNDLISILNKYNPIYVTFKNSGEIKLDQEELMKISTNFPLLLLIKEEKELKNLSFDFAKKFLEKFKKNKPQTEENPKPVKESKPQAKLLIADCLFIAAFSLLTTFGVITGFYEVKSGSTIAIFLFILSFVFVAALNYSVYSVLYKNGNLRDISLIYKLSLFIVLGIGVGIVTGLLTCSFGIKITVDTEILPKYLLIGSLTSVFLCFTVFPLCLLYGYIIRKILDKKNKA